MQRGHWLGEREVKIEEGTQELKRGRECLGWKAIGRSLEGCQIVVSAFGPGIMILKCS